MCFLLFIYRLMWKGMKIMEFMCVTNVDGHSQIHIRVLNKDVHTRRSVEPFKVTNWPSLKDKPISTVQMMNVFLVNFLLMHITLQHTMFITLLLKLTPSSVGNIIFLVEISTALLNIAG